MDNRDRILAIICEHTGHADVHGSQHFMDDLGCDSLDLIELTMAMEDEFHIQISDAETDKITDVDSAVALVQKKLEPPKPRRGSTIDMVDRVRGSR